MKETILIGLLLLATLVSASPYIPYTPYTAHKEKHKNLQLSDEQVAVYFRNNVEKENLHSADEQQKKLINDGNTNDNSEPKSKLTSMQLYAML